MAQRKAKPKKPAPAPAKPSARRPAPRKVRKPKGGLAWKDRFIRCLTEQGTVTIACAAAGIGLSTAYEHRDKDADFAAAWALAMQKHEDMVYSEGYRRAVTGTPKPIYYQGKVVGHVKEYSDSLLLAFLKAKRKEFRDKTEISGPDGGPIELDAREELSFDYDRFNSAFESFARGNGIAAAAPDRAGESVDSPADRGPSLPLDPAGPLPDPSGD